MMSLRHIVPSFSFLLAATLLPAREVRDTLYTSDQDRVIVSYDCSWRDGRVELRFNGPQKKLGATHAARFKRLEEVAVVLFDRTGNYPDVSFSGGLVPEAFMVPSGVSYSRSEDGCFFLHESPSLVFRVEEGDRLNLSIPVYLAYHEKRGRYRIFARCNDLQVRSSPVRAAAASKAEQPASRPVQVAAGMIPEDHTATTRVLDCIANIARALPEQDALPFSENLEEDIRLLRQWQYEVTDRELKAKVSQTLDACSARKRELEKAAAQAEETARRIEEEQARQAEAEEKARIEAETAAVEAANEKTRRRNLWLMVGGGCIALLSFGGNQLIQHRRNSRNQQNMMEMQQAIVKRAENEARRRTGQMVRQGERTIRKEAAGAVKKKVKNISI